MIGVKNEIDLLDKLDGTEKLIFEIGKEDAKLFEEKRMFMLSCDALLATAMEKANNPNFDKILDKFIQSKVDYEMFVWDTLAKYAGEQIAEIVRLSNGLLQFNINPFVGKLIVFKCTACSCNQGK